MSVLVEGLTRVGDRRPLATLLNKWPNDPVIPCYINCRKGRIRRGAKRIALQRGFDMARKKEIISDIDFSENVETQENLRENDRKVRHRGREIKFRVMRARALLLAALRLWELKNRIDE